LCRYYQPSVSDFTTGRHAARRSRPGSARLHPACLVWYDLCHDVVLGFAEASFDVSGAASAWQAAYEKPTQSPALAKHYPSSNTTATIWETLTPTRLLYARNIVRFHGAHGSHVHNGARHPEWHQEQPHSVVGGGDYRTETFPLQGSESTGHGCRGGYSNQYAH